MAIRIRCQDCSKKISIDEAFAGGMCRCPYCKALVFVEDPFAGARNSPSAVRPSAPSSRPSEPAARPDAPATAHAPHHAPAVAVRTRPAAGETEHVPMAKPVKIQGIITIVIMALLVLMIVGTIVMVVMYMPSGENGQRNSDGTLRQGPPESPAPEPRIGQAPTKGAGPGVIDIRIAPPVVYVLDGGSGMRQVFDAARLSLVRSVKSLGGGKFNIIVAGEGEDKLVLPDMTAGGEAAAAKVKTALDEVFPTGAADVVRSLKAALDKKPKTIVVFTQKPIYEAAALAAQAKAQATVIHAISNEADAEVAGLLKELTAGSGGQMRNLRQ